MGRSTKKKSSSAQTQQPRKLSIPELVEAAEHAVAVEDVRHAITLYTVALHKHHAAASSNGNNTLNQWQTCDLLERRAEVYVTIEETDAALSDYQAALEALQAVTTAGPSTPLPAPWHEVWHRQAGLHMYIGQLSTSQQALASYRAGYDLLLQAHECIFAEDAAADRSTLCRALARDYSRVCCSMAELYLTDLCLDDQAEQECERHLQQALDTKRFATLDTDATASSDRAAEQMEAWQLMASFRLSQQRNNEAADIVMHRVYTPWLAVPCRAVAALVGLLLDDSPTDDNSAPTELTPRQMELVQGLPDFAVRCQTSKLLLECAHNLEDATEAVTPLACAQAAVTVLASLVAENDEVIEVWTLLGDALAFVEQRNVSSPSHSCGVYWERALEMLHVVQASLEKEIRDCDMGEDDTEEDAMQQQLDEVLSRIEDLQAKLAEVNGAEEEDMST